LTDSLNHTTVDTLGVQARPDAIGPACSTLHEMQHVQPEAPSVEVRVGPPAGAWGERMCGTG